MLPVPLVLKPEAPPVRTAVKVSLLISELAASGSLTLTPTALLGPLFETMIVYVRALPATAAPTVLAMLEPPLLSVLAIVRSTAATTLSVSDAVLFSRFGSD